MLYNITVVSNELDLELDKLLDKSVKITSKIKDYFEEDVQLSVLLILSQMTSEIIDLCVESGYSLSDVLQQGVNELTNSSTQS